MSTRKRMVHSGQTTLFPFKPKGIDKIQGSCREVILAKLREKSQGREFKGSVVNTKAKKSKEGLSKKDNEDNIFGECETVWDWENQ